MDVFVNMPLNLAHSYERKAERLKKEAKWGEAKEMYLKAAEQMNETISKSNTGCRQNQVRDMLVFQREHFMRQRDEIEHLARAKEEEQLRKQQQQNIAPTPTSGDQTTTEGGRDDDIVDCTYSSIPDSMVTPTPAKQPPGKRKKYPKADTDVIEELQVHNHELRHLVENLLSKIDVLVREKELLLEGNRTLKEENERLINYTDIQRRLIAGGDSPHQFDDDNDDSRDSLLPLVEMGGDCFNFTSVVNELSNAIADDDSY